MSMLRLVDNEDSLGCCVSAAVSDAEVEFRGPVRDVCVVGRACRTGLCALGG